MGRALDTLSIKGFKSIQEMDRLPLTKLNVLIGANGAGKSNFVDFFRMLRAMSQEGLQTFIESGGGADGFLFQGPTLTREIWAYMAFGKNEYGFTMQPNVAGKMIIKNECARYTGAGGLEYYGGGRTESLIRSWKNMQSTWGSYYGKEHYVNEAISSWIVYHFHDTSPTSLMRRDHSVHNWRELLPDAQNIAAFLYKMKELSGVRYQRIRETIQQVAPFFDDFLLEPETKGPNSLIRLQWRQKGNAFPFQPWQFSDGTIRFICLATALLQPNPPSTVLIDEPELGLHPHALGVLGQLVNETSDRTQVIISTQSAPLLDSFLPEHVIVVDRWKGASRFQRLDTNTYAHWLENFDVGELLQKNVIEAGPRYE